MKLVINIYISLEQSIPQLKELKVKVHVWAGINEHAAVGIYIFPDIINEFHAEI